MIFTITRKMAALCAFVLLLTSNLQAQTVPNPYTRQIRNGVANAGNSCGSLWFDGEYLYWQIKKTPTLIPLVTLGQTPVPVLGSPGVNVVLGDNEVSNMWRSGGKFSGGLWLDSAQCFGIEAVYLFLPNGSKSASVSSTGLPGTGFLAVPYFDVVTNAENAYRVSNSDPLLDGGAYSGEAMYKIQNDLQGFELNMVYTSENTWQSRVNLLGGFRYLQFNEKFSFTTSSPFLATITDIYTTADHFDVSNNFYGAQFGVELKYNWQPFYLKLTGKIAVGTTCGRVAINGVTHTNDFNAVPSVGVPLNFEGAIFALPTNIGSRSTNFFTYIPEVGINLGYDMGENLIFNVGYTFLAVSEVLRANEQIDRNLNPTQSPAIAFTPTPAFTGLESPVAFNTKRYFWVQGINVGIEYRF